MDEATRRRELADFLKTKRASISAADAGFYTNSRRRTPGLRREEVAELADIGITWYTWLEQSREIRVSAQVIEKIAFALKLTTTEKRYLFALAGQPLAEDIEQKETVESALQCLLDDLETSPAFVTGRLWHILAWNQAAAALFGNFGKLPKNERNLLRFAFANQSARDLYIDWDDFARTVLARFRRACGSHYQFDAEAVQLIETLKRDSSDFEEFWQRHDVTAAILHNRREFDHPTAGHLVMEETGFQIGDSPDFQLTVYTPVRGLKVRAKILKLIET